MDAIINFDVTLFHLLNAKLSSPVLDVIMPFMSRSTDFFYAIAISAVIALVCGGRKDLRGVGLVMVTVIVSGLTAEYLKEVILRTRPCHALEGVRLLLKCSNTHSLPSGHATYMSAGMVFLSLRHRKFWPYFMAFALVVAYSRVYVGVHYPFDVLSSALFGSSFAVLFIKIENGFFKPISFSRDNVNQ